MHISRPKPRWRRWLNSLTLLVVGGLLLLASPLACTTVIKLPADIADPVTVLLLDHGRTASLVLPDDEGSAARYAFGDWDYYALGKDQPHRALLALFWPTRGAFGRKSLASPVSAENIQQRVRVGIDEQFELPVERQDVRRLRSRFEQMYHERLDQQVVNKSVDLAFVDHDDNYTYFNNSNHLVMDWLRELRCEVRGPAFISRWRIEEQR